MAWLASGLDADKTFTGNQDIPEITELAWMTKLPLPRKVLNRACAPVKAAVDQNKESGKRL